MKSYGSIQNPYESVNAVVNRRTRELTTYRRFDEAPNTITPGITQSDAFERLTQLDTVEWRSADGVSLYDWKLFRLY